MGLIAYKLFNRRKNGTLGSLFINRRAVLPVGEWMSSQLLPKKGFVVRQGWHVLREPKAPHLKQTPNRVWYKVEITHWETFSRPPEQGGVWYLAKWMRILEPV